MDAATPFCDPLGECVACDEMDEPDMACAEVDGGNPLCVGGACVACEAGDTSVCDGQLLLCDEETNACVGCTAHAECEAGACDVFEGRCFDPSNVLDVGMGQTFGTIGAALDEVTAMGWEDAVLVLHAGTDFNEVALVESGALAFVAAEGDSPQWVNTAVMAPTLSVSGAQTRVYVAGVRMRLNGNDTALAVTEAQVDVRDCELASNDILGLSCGEGSRVDIRRSRVVQNTGGGIVASSGCELNVENCFVGGDVEVAGIDINDASATVLYSTVTASTFGTVPALGCSSPMVVDIRNSIIVTQGGASPDELSCATATVTNAATEAEAGMFDVGWFEDFNGGDYGLTASGAMAFENLAQWQDGDPPTDIEGDPRPEVDGSPDHAGADVP